MLPTELSDLVRRENLFLLAAEPEHLATAHALVAEACARGRPPVVAVVGDGGGPDVAAAAAARAVRTDMAGLGVPDERVFLFGLADTPAAGPMFERVVVAVVFLMWRRDCGAILALGPLHHIAAEVVQRSGVEFVRAPGPHPNPLPHAGEGATHRYPAACSSNSSA